jgi:hypothetical protein
MPTRADIIYENGSAGAENPQGMLVAVHTTEISGEAGDKSRRKLKNGGNKIFAPKAASMRANSISHGTDAHWLLAGNAQD